MARKLGSFLRARCGTLVACFLALCCAGDPADFLRPAIGALLGNPGRAPVSSEEEEGEAGKAATSAEYHSSRRRPCPGSPSGRAAPARAALLARLCHGPSFPATRPGSEHAFRNGIGTPLRC